MSRIIAYSEKTGYNDGDYLLLDNGEEGTKRIRADRVGIQLDSTLTDPNKAAPAKAVGDEITNLKADLSDKLDSYLNVEFSIDNKRVDEIGSIVRSNRQHMTDYYPCSEGTVVKWHGESFIYNGASVMCLIAFFNANKTFITGITSVGGEAASVVGDVSTVAPAGTAYVVGSTNFSVVNPYLHVYDINITRIQNESHKAYINLPLSKQIIQSPALTNGSGGNPGNRNAVTARAVPFYDAVSIVVKNNRAVSATGNYYKYDVSAFKGENWYTNRITDILADDNEEFIFDCSAVINGVADITGFGVTIWEYNSSDVLQTLRIGSFDNGDLIVRYVYKENVQTFREINNDEVKHKLLNARHQKGNVGTPLTLLHFSDLHADVAALKRIVDDVNYYYGADINDKICTGDIVTGTYAEIASWWDASVLTCIGNHDTASYSGGTYDWTALSIADRDAYYIAPFESNWGIVHTAGTSYYYKDYTAQKVRLIVMDVMLYNDNGAEATAQTSWLENLLADAITNNLHVLIAAHAPHGGATAKECSFSKYEQGTMPTYTDCNTPQSVIDIVANAISNGLNFIGYIVGHTHQDNIWDVENNGTQLMYCVTCANTASNAQWKNSDQDRSENVDAYNLITIDTTNSLVKIVRGGGADIDDHMRARKAICFDYSTGEKVGEAL